MSRETKTGLSLGTGRLQVERASTLGPFGCSGCLAAAYVVLCDGALTMAARRFLNVLKDPETIRTSAGALRFEFCARRRDWREGSVVSGASVIEALLDLIKFTYPIVEQP